MDQPTLLFRITRGFFRYDSWANRKHAQLAHQIARITYRLAHHLPHRAGSRITLLGNGLEQFAQSIVQPQRRSMHPANLALVLFYGGLIGFWLAATPSLTTLIPLPAWLLALVLLLPFALLTLFLLVSGDIYYEKQDEAQKALSHEAATLTTGVTIVLLLVFALIDKSGPIWQHSSTYQVLTLTLILVMRIVYMAKLASLRWSELDGLDIMEDDLDTAL